MEKIIRNMALEDLLIQLAEEAAELAQASAKLCRILRARNPAAVNEADAYDALKEEIADVNVASEAVRQKIGFTCDEISEIEDAKIERWGRRIENGV